jgi:SAM-dependent methyltransferase
VTGPADPLGQQWDAQASHWIAWARAPGHDSYWQFHRDAFLPLVPVPGRLTVDLGCGEGRLARDLRAAGHRVLAVDYSPAMARATATHPAAPVPAVVGDAARLPLATGCADVAVAFMSLQDVDALADAVREAGRLLVAGGRLALAIVHPVNSAGRFRGERSDPDRPFVIDGSYLEPRRTVDAVDRDGLVMTFHSEHRPLEAYTEALARAGFVIERLREPTEREPGSPWRRVPMFLHILACRRAGPGG